ncbi:response regulator transcription factor [Streptomyces gamaensis]|uniref:Response regulator transcription factor n=1 Tax=Streptomyces gamaensis TaxID=1763542 RepID=A0ABW0YSP3_9ACTN
MHLSPKQEQIFSLIVAGCCNKEIARQLHMSARTVESHLQRLYDRHDVHSRAALVAKWLLEGGLPGAAPAARGSDVPS